MYGKGLTSDRFWNRIEQNRYRGPVWILRYLCINQSAFLAIKILEERI